MSVFSGPVPPTPSPQIKGWCPGALRPMQSGDGLLVRVRPHCGRLRTDQAAGIAALATKYGSGLIDVSSRANIQIRGVRSESHPGLIDGLRALDLIDPTEAVETRRNVMVAPNWSCGDDTQQIARSLEAALTVPDAPDLPAKFGFAVDTGGVPVLRGSQADIRIERAGNFLIVRADGSTRGARTQKSQAVARAMDLARWFLASGGGGQGRGRMAGHLAAGAVLPKVFTHHASAEHQPFRPEPGASPEGFLVGFEFGQLSARTLAGLAALGSLRLTPWRMIMIEGLTNAPTDPALITQPGDPRLRVVACTGAPGCSQGQQQTRPVARRLAPHVPPGQTLHVSGCAKGCAHPGAANLTLVGQPGGFAVIRGGTAGTTGAEAMPLDVILADPASLFGGSDAASL
jgi:precorrin-3B synthase